METFGRPFALFMMPSRENSMPSAHRRAAVTAFGGLLLAAALQSALTMTMSTEAQVSDKRYFDVVFVRLTSATSVGNRLELDLELRGRKPFSAGAAEDLQRVLLDARADLLDIAPSREREVTQEPAQSRRSSGRANVAFREEAKKGWTASLRVCVPITGTSVALSPRGLRRGLSVEAYEGRAYRVICCPSPSCPVK